MLLRGVVMYKLRYCQKELFELTKNKLKTIFEVRPRELGC